MKQPQTPRDRTKKRTAFCQKCLGRAPAWLALFAAVLVGGCFYFYPPLWQPGYSPAGAQSFFVAAEDRVNINTAPLEELTALPGIGEVRAGDIIEYRRQHGGFASPEEIDNIKGVGEKTLAQLLPLICI